LFPFRGTSQPSIDDEFKLVTHTPEITDLFPDVLDFAFRNISNTATGSFSTVTHFQDGRQLWEGKADLQCVLDKPNAVKGACRIVSIPSVRTRWLWQDA